jgi:NADPH2:quinone reductase
MRPGGHEVLKYVTLPDPTPGPGELLVKPTAIGVNFIDTYRRSGVYQVPFPHVPGTEGAGEIAALGQGLEDSGYEVGQKVAYAESVTGGYAELVRVDAARAILLPPGLDLKVAAALPMQGLTADYLVRSTFPVKAGQDVLLYAAAGGVGSLAAQMIHETGARLIATVGDAAKAASLTALGVPSGDVLVLGTMRDLATDLPKAVKDRTGGRGVHVVFDGIGKDTFKASLASLRRRGTLVLFGGASGQVPPLDPQELNAHGSLYLTRPTLADYVATREELVERAERVFGAAARGELTVKIGQEFPLEQAAQAHAALESRATTGKLLLIP